MSSLEEHTLFHFLCVRAYRDGLDRLTPEERMLLFKYPGFDYSGYMDSPVARAENRRRALTLIEDAARQLEKAEALFASGNEA